MKTKITGGTLKGIKIDVPKSARPTTSKSREALMSSIFTHLDNAKVLDIFGGSGSF